MTRQTGHPQSLTNSALDLQQSHRTAALFLPSALSKRRRDLLLSIVPMLRAARAMPALRLLLAALAITLSCPAPAEAQNASDPRIAFDIPAQSLNAALAQYFRTTGVQLLYDASLTRGRSSTAVRGTFSPREALRILLTDTGLVARYSRSNAVTLVAAGSQTQSDLVPLGRVVVRERAPERLSPATRLAYYTTLEDELQNLLRTDERTHRLAFSATVDLSIAPDGNITTIALRKGTGRSSADRALLAVLGEARATPPPAGLSQPLAVNLTGKQR